MKELSIEEKAQAYDKAVKIAKSKIENDKDHVLYEDDITEIFPELQDNKDERIRKELISYITQINYDNSHTWNGINLNVFIDWLEQQGKETSWKPSKEEMDVLYALAYITYEYDQHKEEVITHLYQDLKREFFNGSSYENMFPNTEDGVRRRSTIQVLEYARSLDAYNQYGKADIDKNIAWLKKQGKNNMGISEAAKQKLEDNLNKALEKETPESWNKFLDEQKPADKVEPKFKVGDIIRHKKHGVTCKIVGVDTEYRLTDCNGTHLPIEWQDSYELVEQPTDKDIKEALRTEYEKGRADAIAEVQKSAWSEEDEYVSGKLLNTVTLFNPTSSIFEKLPKEQFIERLKSFKERYTWKPSGE